MSYREGAGPPPPPLSVTDHLYSIANKVGPLLRATLAGCRTITPSGKRHDPISPRPMQLTTTTQTHLTTGAELSMEATAYLDLSTYGTVTARTADGVAITVKATPKLIADAICDWVRSARYCSDSERLALISEAYGRMEKAIAESREYIERERV